MNPIERAIGILISPSAELTSVKSEQITTKYLILQYIGVLAAIPAILYIITMSLSEIVIKLPSLMWGPPITTTWPYPITLAVLGGILYYILIIIGIYVTGIVINKLSPIFASKKNGTEAIKLAAYSATPGVLGSIFAFIPFWVSSQETGFYYISRLFTLYGFYILYRGIPVLMETPKNKTIIYTIVIIAVMVLFSIAVPAILNSGILPPAVRSVR